MLSTEKPPPDLSQNSQLKSISSDEKTCDKNHHLDLYNNPLPSFSIRDYVFNIRDKDVKNNWPFSQKNLLLCLKHGVKDVLPPFQSLESVRNQESAVENLKDNSDAKFSELIHHSVLEKLTVDIEKENSVAEKEFPPAVNSQSCSEVVILPVSSTEKPEIAVRGTNKVVSGIQSSIKKCRLIVKLNNIPEPKPNGDLAVNTPVVSESMASKVCPVCKTFSSSSNTTLNAHIDRCLSGETPTKKMTNAKVIKHRIKPRKIRLMADVYKTALPCTLEDLDRRNGTDWAPNRGPQDLEDASAEEEKKTYSPVNTEETCQDGDVYIDSNGTKLRILSKLSHLPSKSNVNNDAAPSKLVKRDVGKKLLSIKKKKHISKAHKHSLDGQGSCSPDSDHLLNYPPSGSNSCYNGLEVDNDQQKLYNYEGYKEGDPTQPPAVSDQMKSDDFGMIKRWVGSKRTCLKKKINVVHENQHPDRSIHNMRVKSVSSLSKGSSAMLEISSDKNPTESHKRKEDEFIGPSHLRKRPAFPLLASQHSSDKNNHLMFSKFNVKQSSKVHERELDPPNSTENHVSSRCTKKMGMSSNPHIKDDSSYIRSNVSQHHGKSSEGKKFASLRKPSSGGKKFSSLRTKLLSVSHASVTESKKNLGRKLLNNKNIRLDFASDSDEEEGIMSRSALRRKNSMAELLGGSATLPEKDYGQPSVNRTRVLKIRKKVERVWNTGEGDVTSYESDSQSGGKNIDSFTGGDVPIDTSNVVEEEADEMLNEFASEPTYEMNDGEAFASFSKSLDSAFPGLADSGSHYYNGDCPNELVLNGDQDNVGPEMDGDEAQGNYFVDVDPIPIPGPPGSFLPSPRRMGSEDLQGHSSLTTCRLQSSEEGHEVVDMDSSDSPVSGMSGVSNAIAGRPSSISVPNLSHFQHETQCDISVDRSQTPFEQVGGGGDRELNLLESRPEMSHEARNIQLCCCARKDGSFQGGSLNFLESQSLRPTTMTSAVSQENQTCNSPTNEIHRLNVSEKGPTLEPEKPAAASSYPPSPSTPNPVLRLMGKNLMVVNKDDNSSPRTMPVQSSPSPRNGQNEVNSFQHNLSQGPSRFDNNLSQVPSRFDNYLSQGPWRFDNLQPHIPVQPLSEGFKIPANHHHHPSRNFVASVASRCHGFASGFNLIADQLGSKIRLESRTTYDAERVGTESCVGKHKEIIVLDDSPETEAPNPPPFYSYQTRVYHPHFTGSPVGPPPASKANLGKWSCIAEGSSVLHSSSSSTAPLPSNVHRSSSSVYFSPGFS